MKRIYTLIYMCALAAGLCAQPEPETPCWYTPEWDWTEFDGENWKGYWTNQENGPYMSSPFENTSNSDIQDVITAHDFREEQGWVLLYKNFGCSNNPIEAGMPHFFLYNKFTAIVRMFYYVPNEANFSKAKVEIEWFNGSNTSLLTHARKKAMPNEEYTMTDNAEKTLFLIEDQPANGAWVMAEQLIHFDHADLEETDAYWLKVIFTNMIISGVELNGGIEFTTKSQGVKDQNTTPTENNGFKDFLNDAKDRIGKLPKPTDLDGFITNIQSVFPQETPDPEEPPTALPPDAYWCTTDPMNQFPFWESSENNGVTDGPGPFAAVNNVVEQSKFQDSKFYKYTMLGLNNIAPGVSQGIGILLSVMDVFAGKATGSDTTSPAMQPTVSSGSITLNGTITTETDGPLVFLQLPGMAHNISDDQPENWSGLPVYDCPLGNLALESMPEIQKKYYYSHTGLDLNLFDNGMNEEPDYESYDYYVLMDSYNCNENINLALNAPSGLEIEQLWAGFTGELTGELASKFMATEGSLLSDQVEINEVNSDFYYYNLANTAWIDINPIRQLIGNGTYSLIGASLGQPISISTPLIPLEEFKNTTFDIYHGAKVYLKVAALLRPISDSYESTPVLWTTTYEIKDNKITAINSVQQVTNELQASGILLNQQSGFPLTWEQQHNRYSDLVLSNMASPMLVQGVVDDGQYTAFNILADDVDITNSAAGVGLTAEHRIKMATGLKVTSVADKPFKAKVERTLLYATGTDATVVNEYNTGCNPGQIKNMMVENETVASTAVEPFGIYASLVNEQLVLRCPQGEQYAGSVQIANATGQIVSLLQLPSAQDKQVIEVNHLSPGVYYLKGQLGEHVFCCKFVKE